MLHRDIIGTLKGYKGFRDPLYFWGYAIPSVYVKRILFFFLAVNPYGGLVGMTQDLAFFFLRP